MKRQKILMDVQQKIMKETAAGSTERNDNVDLILAKYRLAENETALKAICTRAGGAYKYW